MEHCLLLTYRQTDWDGVNQYEKQRAALLADAGYVAFAADIYGADLQDDLPMNIRAQQATLYRSENVTLFISRMQTAVERVKSYDFVDPDNIAIIGYCFGGTGVIQYAFTGRDDVKVVTAFHGNVQEQFLPETETTIVPYTMVLSGGEDDAHGNQTILEAALNGNNAEWEISRYSGVFHGFTLWESSAYNRNADLRSWSAMMSAFHDRMKVPLKVTASNGSDAGGEQAVPSVTSGYEALSTLCMQRIILPVLITFFLSG